MTARFELLGREFLALNAHPHQPFTEAISFSIEVDSQDEIDYYWRALTADGGKESMCGWLKDKLFERQRPRASRPRHAGHAEDAQDRDRGSRQGYAG